MIRLHHFACLSLTLLLVTPAAAVDLESFEFNDANGTPLTAAVNTANPGNQWSYVEEATTPGDESTGDISTVQSGAYRIITDSAFAPGLESRYLNIANVSSGTIYISATFRNWNFGDYDDTTTEQVRFTFLDDDTGTSGSTVTAQMQIRRNAETGSMELFGDAIGTAGSFDIATTVNLPNEQTQPFQMVLAVDKTSNTYEVFYKDGSSASQALGMGGVSRVRDTNSIRMVTSSFGAENFLPFVITEQANLERLAVSDTNPLTDLVKLTVDRVTGAMSLVNNSGAAVSGVTGVTIESAFGAIDLTDFVDFSGTLANGQTVALDSMPGAAPGLWIRNPVEDIRAELATASGVRTLDVDFVGNGGVKWTIGDLDFDGQLDADDYAILAANAETNLSALSPVEAYLAGDLDATGTNDVVDFGLFKSAFEAANGLGSFAQMLAGAPEPASTLLASLGLAALGTRRRRTLSTSPETRTPTLSQSMKTPLLILAIVASLGLGGVRCAEAVIFEEFLFDDGEGTPVEGVVNNVNPGNMFDADTASTNVATNGLGQLDLSMKDNDDFGTHFVDIEPALTSGIIYGVMELTWDFQSALDTTQNEEIRLSFTNNAPRGTEITAEFQIVRDDSNQMVINGMANGTGSTDLPNTPIVGSGLVQSTKFISVVAADLDNDSYEILYSTNAGVSFLSAGIRSLSPDRVVEAFRLGLNNDFVNDNVLIDRVYITDELPIVGEIDTLTLRVNTTTGAASIVNDTDTDFDIDYYRIQSGDDSLIEANWNSLQNQGYDAVDGADPGATPGDGIGETWTEAGGSGPGVLSESFLLSSSVITSSTPPLSLGAIIDTAGDEELLEFEFRDALTGGVFSGKIEFVAGLDGDYNDDGVVDAIDYAVWRENASGTFVSADFITWRNNYGATSGSSSAATPTPEPSALGLAMSLALAICRRRRARR